MREEQKESCFFLEAMIDVLGIWNHSHFCSYISMVLGIHPTTILCASQCLLQEIELSI